MSPKKRTTDLEMFNPSMDILEFYSLYGEDYTEWFPHADELIETVDKIFYPYAEFVSKDKLTRTFQDLHPATISPFNAYFINKALKPHGLDVTDMFRVNSHGLRSDEFTTDHDGLHILFAGCSITFGDGMFEEYSWARKAYDLIGKEEKVSGYYNIAVPGFNHAQIYSQVFNYINTYGNPDYLFINWPDLRRLINFGIDKAALLQTVHGLQRGLELYCKTNNITLIAFSWDVRCAKDYSTEDENVNDPLYLFNEDPRDMFDFGFYRWTKDERYMHMMKFESENKKHKYKKYFVRAFDIVHPGIAEHDFYAKFAYDTWKEQYGSISSR